MQLSKQQARKIILNAAGLARRAQFGTGIEAVYRLIDHLGFVQLDTNYVVERAHHQMLWSRVPDYEVAWLTELSDDGRIFEFMMSDAGFLPITDFRFSLPVKAAFATRPSTPAEKQLSKQVLDRIGREGPLMVGDFEQDRLQASLGWWDWRPAKIALERLYKEGELMITRNSKFHKVYDLPINLISEDIDQTMPPAEEYAHFMIRRTLGALGIAYYKELNWRSRFVKGHLIKQELANMINAGSVLTVQVEGLKGPLYMLAEQPVEIELNNDTFILSPFDVINVFRHRLRDFFDFEYQIECFVPAPKRKYGYFSHPVLIGDRFVARMDAKADRKNKLLIINNLHFEEVTLLNEQLDQLTTVLIEFTRFNQCKDILFIKSNQPKYLTVLKQNLD